MKHLSMSIVLAAGLTMSSLAAPLVESEPNDTIATADFISAADYPTGAFAFDGSITPGDVDYISFELAAGDFVGATLFDFMASGGDSMLGVFNPAGVLVMSSDDDGLGLFSLLQFTADVSGTWSLAVTGAGDADFNGTGHSQSFNYKLVVGINPIPGPAVLPMLAVGALLRAGRRRR